MAHPASLERDWGRLVSQIFFPDFFPNDHSKSWNLEQSLVTSSHSSPNEEKLELLVSELSFSWQMFLQDIGLNIHPQYSAVSTKEEEEYEAYDAPTTPPVDPKEEDRRPSLSPTDLSSSIRSILQMIDLAQDDDAWMSPKAERKVVNDDSFGQEFYFDLSHLDDE